MIHTTTSASIFLQTVYTIRYNKDYRALYSEWVKAYVIKVEWYLKLVFNQTQYNHISRNITILKISQNILSRFLFWNGTVFSKFVSPNFSFVHTSFMDNWPSQAYEFKIIFYYILGSRFFILTLTPTQTCLIIARTISLFTDMFYLYIYLRGLTHWENRKWYLVVWPWKIIFKK